MIQPESIPESRKRLFDRQRARIMQVLCSAQQRGWYGTLVIKIQAGEVKRFEKTEVVLCDEESPSNGSHTGRDDGG